MVLGRARPGTWRRSAAPGRQACMTLGRTTPGRATPSIAFGSLLTNIRHLRPDDGPREHRPDRPAGHGGEPSPEPRGPEGVPGRLNLGSVAYSGRAPKSSAVANARPTTPPAASQIPGARSGSMVPKPPDSKAIATARRRTPTAAT